MFTYLELRKLKIILEKDVKIQERHLENEKEESVTYHVMNETMRQDRDLLNKINRLIQENYKAHMGGNFIEREVDIK